MGRGWGWGGVGWDKAGGEWWGVDEAGGVGWGENEAQPQLIGQHQPAGLGLAGNEGKGG